MCGCGFKGGLEVWILLEINRYFNLIYCKKLLKNGKLFGFVNVFRLDKKIFLIFIWFFLKIIIGILIYLI